MPYSDHTPRVTYSWRRVGVKVIMGKEREGVRVTVASCVGGAEGRRG